MKKKQIKKQIKYFLASEYFALDEAIDEDRYSDIEPASIKIQTIKKILKMFDDTETC
jgi:hypothetical protein